MKKASKSSTASEKEAGISAKKTSGTKSMTAANTKTLNKSAVAAKTASKTSRPKATKSKSESKTSGKSSGKKAGSAAAKSIESSVKKTNAKVSGLVSEEKAQEGMRLLCQKYPDADCELTYKNDFELLTAVILSAQTTDVQVNKVTPSLFKKFPDAKALAEANLDEVKEIVKPTGYYNNKAKAIQACAAALVQKFGGKVPATQDELTTLPGVGRKTANVVLGVIHEIPGWTVDTHVQRLTQRLGFTKNTDPYKIEMDLQKLFPEQNWTKYSITLIWHGRRQCYARNPDCPACPLKHLCPSSLAP